MITKYKQYNESIKSLLVGPSKEEVWKNLGYDITFDTPEEFILYMIDGMKIKKQTIYPSSIFWEKNGEIILEQELKIIPKSSRYKHIWVDFKSFWLILRKVFNLNYDQTQRIMNNTLEEKLKWYEYKSDCNSQTNEIKWKSIDNKK